MKLTTKHIQKVALKDNRIDEVEICPDGQVTVWLNPEWTWNPSDGNITCMIYNVEGSPSEYRDDLTTFEMHLKYIEKAM